MKDALETQSYEKAKIFYAKAGIDFESKIRALGHLALKVEKKYKLSSLQNAQEIIQEGASKVLALKAVPEHCLPFLLMDEAFCFWQWDNKLIDDDGYTACMSLAWFLYLACLTS